MRGARKHILCLVESSDFTTRLSQILKPTGAIIQPNDEWMPKGFSKPDEARMEKFGSEAFPDEVFPKKDWQALHSWWLIHKRWANTPNWDLASTCTINGRKGLVLVEAKAHTNELKTEGKILPCGASIRSRENHDRIWEAICEASQALAKEIPGVNILRDTHYQLANRVAFSWKIASMGIPVVLVYLGFIGDKDMANVGEPLRNDKHWQCVMQSHMAGHIPKGFVGKWIKCGESEQMIIRSLPVSIGLPSQSIKVVSLVGIPPVTGIV